jgi:chemotaxis protein CheX
MAGKTIDVNLINPFIEATLECLKDMAGMQPVRQRIFLKTDPTMHGDVAGIIGLSRGITGSCVVSFPLVLARRIVAGMLMDEPDKLTLDMVNDGIGEVANMVAGGAKRRFSTTSYKFDISVPTVIAGTPVALYNPQDVVSIACLFQAKPEWPEAFLIEIALKPGERPA